MSASSRDCEHTRGRSRLRSTAITVCHGCRDYLCSICGVTIAWREGLSITNPVVQWRYCTKDACIAAEALYHALPVEEMTWHRASLRAKRVRDHLVDRGSEPRPKVEATSIRATNEEIVSQDGASGPGSTRRPERIVITPAAFKLDRGEACWCNLGKDCIGYHEIYLGPPVHRCGLCGQTFEIKPDDPHWVTGRGPICPKESA